MPIKTSFTRFAFICLMVLTAPSAFSQKVIKTDTSNYKKLRIDPANANGGNVSDVFDEVNYIPLETTPQSLFGSIKQLEVTDKYFIIRDENTNSVLLFTKDGKFHAKITGKPNSLVDRIKHIAINREAKMIVCDAYYQKRYYDFDGKLIKEIAIKSVTDNEIYAEQYYYLNKNLLVNYRGYEDRKPTEKGYKPFTRSLLQFITDDKTVAATGLRYGEQESKVDVMGTGENGPLTYFGNDKELFFTRPYANEIYSVTANGVKLSYKMLFPAYNSLPMDFITNPDYNRKRIDYVQKNTTQIFGISNCYLLKNNLLFKIHMWDTNDEDNLIYNLQSGTMLAYKHILEDEKTCFLPIYDKIGSDFNNVGLAACDGTYIYTSMSSIAMFKAKDDTRDQHPKYNAILTRYFGTGTNKDNPVIVQLKLKEKL